MMCNFDGDPRIRIKKNGKWHFTSRKDFDIPYGYINGAPLTRSAVSKKESEGGGGDEING